MDLPRLYAMNDYWQQHPPVHIMVAAYLGIKPKATATATPVENDPAEVQALLAMFAAT
jgi:hypothetical protein